MKSFTVLALVLASVTLAAADPVPSDAQGKVHFDRGQALYRDGMYREARDEFVRGFELTARAAFLFNVAECSRLLGELAVARDQYERYLALEPAGKLAAIARQRLAALPAEPAAPAAPAATAVPELVPPPLIIPIEPALPTLPTLPTVPRVDTRRWPSPIVLVTAGAGVVALGATGVLAVRARRTWIEAQHDCVGDRCNATGFALAADARRDANWATATLVAGTAALGVAGWLWWRERRAGRARVGVAVSGEL